MQNNKFLIFHASGVDSSSVISHDTGTNIDLACFPSSAITAIMAEEDMVYLYFKDATRFQGSIGSATEVMEQAYVRLTTAEGKELDVVKDLTKSLGTIGVGGSEPLLFDAVNNIWSISNVTAIQIRRHLTTHTIASD
tara:strand:- start:228 stop:638 length:411 start_codon:yes stop_codon:yes gene_type:complete